MSLDLSKPIQLRDGRAAHFVGKMKDGQLVVQTDASISIRNYDGSEYTKHETKNDIINVPEKIVRWVNLYDEFEDTKILFESRRRADECQVKNRIACIRIEFTRGQFDE